MARRISTKTIAALPQVKREKWEMGRRPLNVAVVELQRKGEQPEILLAVQTGDRGGVVGYALLSSTAPVSALSDFALRTMQQPMVGRPRRPQAIRVATEAEAEVLVDPLAEVGVWMDVSSPLTTLDRLHRELQSAMGGPDGGYRTLAAQAAESLDDDVLREFFRVAKAFYRAQLWIDFGGEVMFEIELQPAEGPPKTLYGILLGSMGQEFGLALYASLVDLQRFHEVGEQNEEQLATAARPAKRRSPTAEELQTEAQMLSTLLSVPCVGLTFTPQKDVPPPLIEEAKALQLPLANKSAFPLVMKTGSGRMQVAGASDLQDMLAAMRAILHWDQHMTRMEVDDEIDVTVTSSLPAIGDILSQTIARTTLRLNPYAPAAEAGDDILPEELNDLFQAFLQALPPMEEPTRRKTSKGITGKAKKAPQGSAQPRPRPSPKGRRKE